MDLAAAEDFALEKMAFHGLTQDGWTFAWNNMKTVFGITYYDTKVIGLSRPRAAHESEASVIDTILHEVAHAIAGPQADHGPAWKRVARQLGCSASPVAYEEPGGLRASKAPWVGTCPNGHVLGYRFFRKPTTRRSCSHCSPGRFDPEFLYTFTREGS